MESVICPFCKVVLDSLSVREREEHCFDCLNRSTVAPNTPTVQKSATKPETSQVSSPRKCSICGSVIAGTLETRQNHVVKCARRNKLGSVEQLRLVRAERNFPDTPNFELSAPSKRSLKLSEVENPQNANDAEIMLAVAISKSEEEKRAIDRRVVQENFDRMTRPNSTLSLEETVYDDTSFVHPQLKRNNNVFEEGYSCELLTTRQRHLNDFHKFLKIQLLKSLKWHPK